ncbi:MAG: thioredoxin family protein [Bacteroidia bacterium]
MKTLIKTHSFTYKEFAGLMDEYAASGKTSGASTPEHISATKLNAQRMQRISKQCEINDDLKNLLQGIKQPLQWIIIAETWCGDGAQNIPVLAKMAELNPLIELRIIFRDENPEYMEIFLTNGSKAIPKLICADKISGETIGTWGPRPARIRQMALDYKKEFPEVAHDEFVRNLHTWYAKDKTISLQEEFIEILKGWKINKAL